MGVIIHSFNLNISPKMLYGMLECDIVMLYNYMLMIFVVKDFVIKRGGICAIPYIFSHLLGDIYLEVFNWTLSYI